MSEPPTVPELRPGLCREQAEALRESFDPDERE